MEIAQSFHEAAKVYQNNPTALHLRAMNMLYEGLKEKGALMLIPSSAVESMGMGGLFGAAALCQQSLMASGMPPETVAWPGPRHLSPEAPDTGPGPARRPQQPLAVHLAPGFHAMADCRWSPPALGCLSGPPMIRWRSSTQLAYAGDQFADIFRATAQWSRTSHIPVDITSAQEAVDHHDGGLWYDLDVVLALHTGGARELADLASHLVGELGAGWTVTPEGDGLRCEFDLRRHAVHTTTPPGAAHH